jgi:hypothetical protein
MHDTVRAPQVLAYEGLPQGMAAPSMGSHDEIGVSQIRFDRVGRFSPYGWVYAENNGGLGIGMKGDNEGTGDVAETDCRKIIWHDAQEKRLERNAARHEQQRTPRQVLILRTWHDFHYTPHHITILRAILNELSLGSGGEYVVRFLIHAENGTIPILGLC